MKTVDSNKVRDSIKAFLEKMKAFDGDIPEELAQDALEMTEEVSDALACEVEDEDADVLEITKDEEAKEDDIEKKVEDTMMKVFRKMGMVKDNAMKSLDAVEEELEAADKDECNTLDEDSEEETTKSNDAMLKFIRNMKPVIASVKDSKQRKRLADELASFAKLQKTADYAGIMNTAKQNAKNNMNKTTTTTDTDYDFGMSVAKKWNPHYKEEN